MIRAFFIPIEREFFLNGDQCRSDGSLFIYIDFLFERGLDDYNRKHFKIELRVFSGLPAFSTKL